MSADDIKLPPLARPQVPRVEADVSLIDIKVLARWCERTATEYARAAVLADRQQRGGDVYERAAKLDAECNSLAHQLNASNERNGVLRAALSDCSAELFAQCGDQPRAMLYVNAARVALAAQAVDLGPAREVFRRWHANELNSTDAMLALAEAMAVLDTQAVTKAVDLEQFRRVVKYAKYWADEKGNDEVGAAADRLLALIDAQKEARNG